MMREKIAINHHNKSKYIMKKLFLRGLIMIEAILVLTLSNTILIWYFHYQQEERNNLILETIKDHHFYYGRPEED